MTSIGNFFNGLKGLMGYKSTDWGSWVIRGDPWGRVKGAKWPKKPFIRIKAKIVVSLKIHGDRGANNQRTQYQQQQQQQQQQQHH